MDPTKFGKKSMPMFIRLYYFEYKNNSWIWEDGSGLGMKEKRSRKRGWRKRRGRYGKGREEEGGEERATHLR